VLIGFLDPLRHVDVVQRLAARQTHLTGVGVAVAPSHIKAPYGKKSRNS
jgi:hypothetical protein